MPPEPIRVLTLMEAYWMTGPARNLILFAGQAKNPGNGWPPVALSVVTFQRRTLEPNEFICGARQNGVPVDVLAECFRFDPRVVAQLRSVVKQRAPHIIQTHNVKSHFLVRLTGLWRSYRWIAFHHGYTATDRKTAFYNQFDRWSLPLARRVVSVCGAFEKELRTRGVPGDRIRVQHNPVKPLPPATPGECDRIQRELAFPSDAKVLLSVGRLSREKGHADLLRAVAELRRRCRELPWRLVLVGDGPERPRLEEQCAALRLGDAVVFAGHQSKVRPYYSLADVVVLPSHSEGSPNVLLEAIAAGVPVVATAVGGIPEVVAHERSALLVGCSDIAAMATATERLVRDPELARHLVCEARAVVAGRLTAQAYCRSIIGVYQEVLGSPPDLPQGERSAACAFQ